MIRLNKLDLKKLWSARPSLHAVLNNKYVQGTGVLGLVGGVVLSIPEFSEEKAKVTDIPVLAVQNVEPTMTAERAAQIQAEALDSAYKGKRAAALFAVHPNIDLPAFRQGKTILAARKLPVQKVGDLVKKKMPAVVAAPVIKAPVKVKPVAKKSKSKKATGALCTSFVPVGDSIAHGAKMALQRDLSGYKVFRGNVNKNRSPVKVLSAIDRINPRGVLKKEGVVVVLSTGVSNTPWAVTERWTKKGGWKNKSLSTAKKAELKKDTLKSLRTTVPKQLARIFEVAGRKVPVIILGVGSRYNSIRLNAELGEIARQNPTVAFAGALKGTRGTVRSKKVGDGVHPRKGYNAAKDQVVTACQKLAKRL